VACLCLNTACRCVDVDVSAREHGSNKMIASKSCALSLVRQLFHFNIIEAFSGVRKKKKDSEVMATDHCCRCLSCLSKTAEPFASTCHSINTINIDKKL